LGRLITHLPRSLKLFALMLMREIPLAKWVRGGETDTQMLRCLRQVEQAFVRGGLQQRVFVGVD